MFANGLGGSTKERRMSILYAIAILGCGEGSEACQPVRISDARYESRESCLAATEAQLARSSDIEFPVVVAECRPVGAAPASLRASDVLLPAPDRRPSAWDR
jgi:hypothetical protein